MKVYVISFCIPQAGVFGLVEPAFFDEAACQAEIARLKEEDDEVLFTMDELPIEVNLQ